MSVWSVCCSVLCVLSVRACIGGRVCNISGTLRHGRDSSVWKASDRRSEGPRFHPGSRHKFTYLLLSFCSRLLICLMLGTFVKFGCDFASSPMRLRLVLVLRLPASCLLFFSTARIVCCFALLICLFHFMYLSSHSCFPFFVPVCLRSRSCLFVAFASLQVRSSFCLCLFVFCLPQFCFDVSFCAVFYIIIACSLRQLAPFCVHVYFCPPCKSHAPAYSSLASPFVHACSALAVHVFLSLFQHHKQAAPWPDG